MLSRPLARRRPKKRNLLPAALATPLLVVLLLLVLFPFVFELYLSFTNWQTSLGDWWNANFVGIENYKGVVTSHRFWIAILHTLLIVGIGLLLEGGFGLILALIFADKFHGRRVLMALLLTPMMVLPLVNGFIFFMMFQSAGPINAILGGIVGHTVDIGWLTQGNTALATIIFADVYQWTPLMFLILLAGVLTVPRNLVDASRTIGASSWQRFRYLTLPMIRPVIVIALIIRGIEAFKIFDPIYIMTGGGPGTSTESINNYLYELGFQSFQLGYAAAAAFVVLILVTIVAMRAVKYIYVKEEEVTAAA